MPERENSADRGNDGTTGRGGAEAARGGGIVGVVFKPFEVIGTMIGKAVEAIFRDGTLEAAGRQGLDELGAALKPFPDSIQVHETGTIWNPTPGEVQKGRDPERQEKRSWSSLAVPRSAEAENGRQPRGYDQDYDNGQDHGMSM